MTPVIFIAHGAPFLLDDLTWVAELHAWAQALPRPRAILSISAHWEASPLTVGATATIPLVYDFSGFPDRFYQLKYPAPGAPGLAARVRELVTPTAQKPDRGLDHGTWVPLLAMYPEADVPVLQVSLPTLEPRPLLELGQKLAPLRDEGVLIATNGFLTHNLSTLDRRPDAPVAAWAQEFDAWCADVLVRKDVDALLEYRTRAPGVKQALPTHEHFVPVILALGAALDASSPVTFPISGFMAGTITRRSVQLGS